MPRHHHPPSPQTCFTMIEHRPHDRHRDSNTRCRFDGLTPIIYEQRALKYSRICLSQLQTENRDFRLPFSDIRFVRVHLIARCPVHHPGSWLPALMADRDAIHNPMNDGPCPYFFYPRAQVLSNFTAFTTCTSVRPFVEPLAPAFTPH